MSSIEKSLNRFLRKVEFTETCWLWRGSRRSGYGLFKSPSGAVRSAHRWLYQMLIGMNPDLTLDHLCRVRHCVNPDHLEVVTMKVNVLRGVGAGAENSRKTHCKRGHEFTPENTLIYRNSRFCRACRRESQRQVRERRTGRN